MRSKLAILVGAGLVCGYPAPSTAQYDSMCAQYPASGISNREELAEFLAQAMQESDGLRTKRDDACQQTGCAGEYETIDCDVSGQDYYPRGYSRLTGCPNYKAASQALFGDDRLVEDPDSVARDEGIAWGTAFLFWNKT